MEREISSLPLALTDLDALLKCGFSSVSDLVGIKPLDLHKETGISLHQSHQILQLVKVPTGQPIPSTAGNTLRKSGWEPVTMRTLMSKLPKNESIITFCRSIDKMIGGGVPLGQVTEFVGAPGIGKSQLSMQLAVDVQIPPMFGGVGGRALYIDTEGGFHPQRAYAMAKGMSDHIQRMANQRPRSNRNTDATLRQSRLSAAATITPESLLAGIHVCRVHSQTELHAVINTLPGYFSKVEETNPLRLVIVDSIAFHFRHDIVDTKSRGKMLAMIANKLQDIATTHGVAVVTTNHVTTRVGDFTPLSANTVPPARTMILPALGEHWSRGLSTRIMLQWLSSKQRVNHPLLRAAVLMKSASMPQSTCAFEIGASGVRDIPSAKSVSNSRAVSSDASTERVPFSNLAAAADRAEIVAAERSGEKRGI
eukprot:GSChrysophyteH1.ASY1.ANO1.418.1 assembled CDS